MDKEIMRLLQLSRIPNFRLSEEEQNHLDEWKSKQVKIVPKKAKKTTNQVKPEAKETGEIEEL